MSRIRTMTDEEILKELRQDSRFNRARRVLSNAYGEIEQGMEQRRPPTAFDVHNIHFDTIRQIAEVLGVVIHEDDASVAVAFKEVFKAAPGKQEGGRP